MNTKKGLVASALTAAALITMAPPAWASSTFGAYVAVEKVDVKPAPADGQSEVTIVGQFRVYDPDLAAAFPPYGEAQHGTMRFVCPAGKGEEEKCALEWKDLARAVGTCSCAGFGELNTPAGTVYGDDEAVGDPDPWTHGIGVLLTPGAFGMCPAMQAAITSACGPVAASKLPAQSRAPDPSDVGAAKPATAGGCTLGGAGGPGARGAMGLVPALVGIVGLLARRRRR